MDSQAQPNLGVRIAGLSIGGATIVLGRCRRVTIGDVNVQVRAPDVLAASWLATLGLIAVGVILCLGPSEDAGGYATLSASGRTTRALASAVIAQSLVNALAGSVLGVVIAVAAIACLVGGVPTGLLLVSGLVAAVSLIACVVVALVPGFALRRLPLTQLLAGD